MGVAGAPPGRAESKHCRSPRILLLQALRRRALQYVGESTLDFLELGGDGRIERATGCFHHSAADFQTGVGLYFDAIGRADPVEQISNDAGMIGAYADFLDFPRVQFFERGLYQSKHGSPVGGKLTMEDPA